jgi:ribonuclease E
MTTKRMLIDATHPEETRVVVLSGNRLEDFDVEVASRKQLKGNIYLAKVTRVEPSLQAAFVDYGGNRHGFLAFNEIHPDYYQIPVADREILVAQHDAAEKEDEATKSADEGEDPGGVETIGGDDSEEVEARRPIPSPRHYKIQEVIKRRQIILVQVVKEERGNKGAALTTYISLAGRYCVLMPNTARGGGISRKITNSSDRKRLKTILRDLGIPEGMAVIVRTAGAERNKTEIRRDYEYLLRLWNSVREHTLESVAPALVHEEANLIKRTIRDLYNSEISEVIVAGDDAYRLAKNFMKLLIPSHAKKVQPYRDESAPLIHHYEVESQLDAIHNPVVQLRSGGYIVINSTEALVAIDVNSGRSTRERNIEETALKTNLEAADEIARQLRLRDLAGLVVIDYIDMEVSRNNAQVERRLKEAMRGDRARIQLGRISPFGLLELSRQRLRPSLQETSSEPCPYCAGSGIRRSTESTALYVLRAIEEEGLQRPGGEITVHMPNQVALYVLNHKRAALTEIEARHDLTIVLDADDSLVPPDHRIERPKGTPSQPVRRAKVVEEEPREEVQADGESAPEEENGKRRRRRRPRRRKPSEEERPVATETEQETETAVAEPAQEPEREAETAEDSDDETQTKRRRRGRRGGRRRPRRSTEPRADEDVSATDSSGAEPPVTTTEPALPATDSPEETTTEEAPAKKPARRRRATRKTAEPESSPEMIATELAAELTAELTAEPETPTEPEPEAEPKPKPRRRRVRAPKVEEAVASETPAEAEAAPEEKPKPRRRRRNRTTVKETAPEQVVVAEASPEAETTPETVEVVEAPRIEVEPPAPPAPVMSEPEMEQPAAQGDRTVVVNVGSDDLPQPEKAVRKGWWQRILD